LPAGHFDEVDRRHALANQSPGDFVLDVLIKLPFAKIALEVVRRDKGEQQPRLAQSLQDAVTPVVHALNLGDVEERTERAAGMRLEVAADALDKLGDAAVPIVASRVRDEEIVGHGVVLGFSASRPVI